MNDIMDKLASAVDKVRDERPDPIEEFLDKSGIARVLADLRDGLISPEEALTRFSTTSGSDQELLDCRDTLGQLEEERNELTDRVNQLSRERGDLKRDLDEARKKCDELQQQLDDVTKERDALQDKIQSRRPFLSRRES